MLKYKVMPVIWAGDLEVALKERYGEEFLLPHDSLRQILFDDRYMNDVCVDLNILDIEEWEPEFENYPWANKRHMEITKKVKLFLQEVFPGQEYVLIDVMW